MKQPKADFRKRSAIACWGFEPLCMMCELEKADGDLSQDLYGHLEDQGLPCDNPRVCSQGCYDSAIESAFDSFVL